MKKEITKQKQSILDNTKLFSELRELILSARQAVARNVNTIQVITNFEIGHRIVEHEQGGKERAQYGTTVLKDLSNKLLKEFGRGFSERNLDYMRKFYLMYQNRIKKISQMPSAELIKGRKSRAVSGKSQKAQIVSAQSDKAVFPLS